MFLHPSVGPDPQDAVHAPSNYLDLVYVSSTLLSMWSFSVVFNLCRVPLSDVHIVPKFFCLQGVLLIVGVQRSVISIFELSGLIRCQPPLLPAESVTDRTYIVNTILGHFVVLNVRIYHILPQTVPLATSGCLRIDIKVTSSEIVLAQQPLKRKICKML